MCSRSLSIIVNLVDSDLPSLLLISRDLLVQQLYIYILSITGFCGLLETKNIQIKDR